jgi:hypothetical protein
MTLDYRSPEVRTKNGWVAGWTSFLFGLWFFPLMFLAPIIAIPMLGVGLILAIYATVTSRGRSIGGLLGLIICGLFACDMIWSFLTDR